MKEKQSSLKSTRRGGPAVADLVLVRCWPRRALIMRWKQRGVSLRSYTAWLLYLSYPSARFACGHPRSGLSLFGFSSRYYGLRCLAVRRLRLRPLGGRRGAFAVDPCICDIVLGLRYQWRYSPLLCALAICLLWPAWFGSTASNQAMQRTADRPYALVREDANVISYSHGR